VFCLAHSRTAARALAALLAAFLLPLCLFAQISIGGQGRLRHSGAGESCLASKDLVVQALEILRADSPQSDVEDADQLLKRAIELCAESGEAWYFRSLVESHLGHTALADYTMRQARLFPSDALREGINPFVLSTPPPGHAAPLPPVRQKWALVIGVGTFSDPSIEGLAYTAADATAFRDLLLDPKGAAFPPDHVALLTNDDATLEHIKEKLNWLGRSAQPDDLAVVYIASHGSARDVDSAGASYILTHDTLLGPDHNPDSLYASALPMAQLADDVATRFHSLRTAIFLDTCYSGGAVKAAKKLIAPGIPAASLSRASLDQIGQGTGRIIFAASRSDQESLQSDALGHGYFTYYLIQALKQHPGLPLSQIFTQVQQDVSKQVASDYQLYNLHQTPVMGRSSDNADFALAAPAPAAADAPQAGAQ